MRVVKVDDNEVWRRLSTMLNPKASKTQRAKHRPWCEGE
jgi:hypothetical protein